MEPSDTRKPAVQVGRRGRTHTKKAKKKITRSFKTMPQPRRRSKSRSSSRRQKERSRRSGRRYRGYEEPYGLSWLFPSDAQRKAKAKRNKLKKERHLTVDAITQSAKMGAKFENFAQSLEDGLNVSYDDQENDVSYDLVENMVLMTSTGIILPGTNRKIFLGKQSVYEDDDSVTKSYQKIAISLHEVSADPEGAEVTPLEWYIWKPNLSSDERGRLEHGDVNGAHVTYPAMTVHREIIQLFRTPVKPKDFERFVDQVFPHKTGNATWEQIKKDIVKSCEGAGGCTAFPGCGSVATPYCEDPITYVPVGERI